MNWLLRSHRIGNVFGIDVRLSYALYLVTGIWAVSDLGGPYPLLALATLLLPGFVFLHELGHSLMAIRHRVPVEEILLHPLGGMARLGGMVPGPWAEIRIALAGPGASLLLAGACYAAMTVIPPQAALLAYVMMRLNLMLALFNLLPFYPMDGGRVAYAAAVMLRGPERGAQLAATLSKIGFGLLIAYGAYSLLRGDFGGIFLILIGLYLYQQGQQELSWQYGTPFATARRAPENTPPPRPGFFARLKAARQRRQAQKEDALRREVDRILAKVKAEGIGALTGEERQTLSRASHALREQMKP